MNKTVIINIGNSIIHIEEEAYEMLMTYLNEIKQHFAKNADDFEIVKDIENRIAEMFAEIIQKEQKQVIDLADVKEVVGQMGSVRDFLADEEEQSASNYEANFVGVKKLYRDTDAGVIAGVCAGLAHYLNVEKRWLRLAFLLLMFLGGSGVLVYLIFWIATPRAANRSERMEMKGEATNLYGYKRSFDEEVEMLKRNMKSANREMSPAFAGIGGLLASLFSFAGKVIGVLVGLVGKFFAWFIIVFGFGMMIFMIVSLGMLVGFWDNEAYQVFPLNVINASFRDGLIFHAFLTFFIPLLALVLFALKVVNNRIEISKYVWFGLMTVWLIGVVTSAYYAAKVFGEFKEEAELVQHTDLKPFKTYVIDVDRNMVFNREDSAKYHLKDADLGKRTVVDNFDNGPFRSPRNVSFEIEKSNDGKTSISAIYQAQGKDFATALRNVKNISYNFVQKDSTLVFNPSIQLKQNAAWRDQTVHLSLRLPVGARVLINDNNDRYWSFYQYVYGCNNDENVSNGYREWIMTEEGLKCKYEIDQPMPEE